VAPSEFRPLHLFCVFLVCWSLFHCSSVRAQQQTAPSADKQAAPETPAQFELLETRYRFEASGDSRKELHARVQIHSELGVRQFARLNFDYNRAFESIDIPLVRITHPGGGTADILPSAITDNPNPAVVNAPAYQDVRVKSVRILGLAPGDQLEYRVVTSVTHHPLAPDFWLDHSFNRTGVVSEELFELDLPVSPTLEIRFNPDLPPSTEQSGAGDSARKKYQWHLPAAVNDRASAKPAGNPSDDSEPDVMVSTFSQWAMLSIRLDEMLTPGTKKAESTAASEEQKHEQSPRYSAGPELTAKALRLTKTAKTSREKLEALYEFVSQTISTIDLPLGSTGFVARRAEDVLASRSAIPEDKFVLFAALAAGLKLHAEASLTGYCEKSALPRPSVFKHLLISAHDGKKSFWVDPSLEVAPFGMISPIPQKCAFLLNRQFISLPSTGGEWQLVEREPPFAARQKVVVDASLAPDGKLSARVHYSLRGDNELLLRVAFHQAPKEKWKDLAQLLSLSDGFRGKVGSVTASNPSATRLPFTLDYEITMPKFADWSKKPVRIPALLPQIGLPDPPAKSPAVAASSPIELGTPLEVETHMTLRLPAGTTIETPTGTSVRRDYATFASQYSQKGSTITASRHIRFLLREVPAERAADYNAFLRAVLNDEAQDFTLDRPAASPSRSSTPNSPKTGASFKPAKP